MAKPTRPGRGPQVPHPDEAALEQRLESVKTNLHFIVEAAASQKAAASALTDIAEALDQAVRLLGGPGTALFRQDDPWEKGDCHGYIWATVAGPSLWCKGPCPDDPRGRKCRKRRIHDDPNKKTTYFCSCSEEEPKGCHLVLVHHHDTGVWEPKCTGSCEEDGHECKLKRQKHRAFDWWFYWCECEKKEEKK